MSPKLELNLEPSAELTPDLQVRLHSALSQYTGLTQQIEMLQELADQEKARMMAILEEGGIASTQQDGFSVAIVRGTSSKLNKTKLIALGCTHAMLEMATTRKPKKPYVCVRKPGEKADAGDDD